ncbi:alpha/beta hydrolase [Pigmentiphaga soli]|uniref:Alpha/beta hydrolase n=1 Tax=Pigmentiphaga soli TaxID=1007095 RepID=A0ABP8H717_9BURK
MRTEDWKFEDYDMRVYRGGRGPALLLLHGIGPGTSIPANFSGVFDALAERFEVYGIDLIGMGASARKTAAPLFDFELWVRQAAFAAARIAERSGEAAIRAWGHSMGGAIALRLAAETGLLSSMVATGTGGGQHRVNPALDAFWQFPSSEAELKAAMLGSMFDPAAVTDDLVAGRFATLRDGDAGPYFRAMMEGDRQALLDSARLSPEQLGRIRAPVLLIHGRDDRPCPYEDNAVYLLRHIPGCELAVFPRCGHNPAREHRDKTLARVLEHLA